MFKKIIFSTAILLGFVSSVFSADLKVAVFDERLILSKIPQVELINAKLQKQFEDRMSELKALQEKGTKLRDQGTRDAVTMTQAQKIQLQRDLEGIGADLAAKDKNLKEDLQRANQLEIQKIRIKVQQTVNKIAVDEKYDLVLRVESTAYHAEALNISNKVITILSNPAG